MNQRISGNAITVSPRRRTASPQGPSTSTSDYGPSAISVAPPAENATLLLLLACGSEPDCVVLAAPVSAAVAAAKGEALLPAFCVPPDGKRDESEFADGVLLLPPELALPPSAPNTRRSVIATCAAYACFR